MKPTSLVAKPVTDADKTLIAASTLWHFTKPRYASQIRAGTAPGSNLELVHIKAFSGWSLNPTKLLRDWSVWDRDFKSPDYARYIYFFIGRPSEGELKFLKLQGITSSIEIKGEDLLTYCSGRVFLRRSDNAVVVRGDYLGPAIFTP